MESLASDALEITLEEAYDELEFIIENDNDSLLDDWNMFIKVLLLAQNIWDTRLMNKSASDIAKAGDLPKIYANYKRSKFTNIAPRLVSFARGSGGLKEFLVDKER